MAGLWMIRDTQNYFDIIGNPFINIYGYVSTLAVIGEADALADAFVAQMLPKIIDVQNADLYHFTIEAIQLDGTAYAARALTSGHGGTRVGTREPNFEAWGFKYQRAVTGVRSGAKRIGGVTDEDTADGVATGTVVAKLSALATQMAAPLMEGIVQTWFPVILERPVPPSTTWGYHSMSTVNYVGITTQNTRKR